MLYTSIAVNVFLFVLFAVQTFRVSSVRAKYTAEKERASRLDGIVRETREHG